MMISLNSHKNLIRNYFFHAAMLSLSLLLCICNKSSFALDWTRQVDSLFSSWNNSDSPGVALALVHNGEIVYKNGYGIANLRYGLPITPSTIFRTGSNTKQFTAFSILLLEEDGKLNLDDDIHLYVPEIPEYEDPITIRHLIYHTSGIRSHISLMTMSGLNLFEDVITREQSLEIIKRQKKVNFLPGDQFMYSNSGYMLLAEIVARVSGMTFPEFVRERIFEPLEMTESGFIDNYRAIIKNMADAYMPLDNGEYEYTSINYASVGEGGIYSTVEDLAKWDQNFYDPIVGSRSLVAKMQIQNRLNDGSKNPMSMGLIVESGQGPTVIYHGGDIPGFHCQHLRVPDFHMSVILMANTSDLFSTELARKSIKIIEIYRQNQDSSINDFQIHEPSLDGWGLSNFRTKRIKPSISAKGISPKFSPESVEEYLGRYYCEDIDVFYNVFLDDEGLIAFQPPRVHPYLFRINEILNNDGFQEYDLANFSNIVRYSGRFLRNLEGRVTGFLLSSTRVNDLEFTKAKVVPVSQ
jgi:CubicO group peptidase (beta-lactamase class C family)